MKKKYGIGAIILVACFLLVFLLQKTYWLSYAESGIEITKENDKIILNIPQNVNEYSFYGETDSTGEMVYGVIVGKKYIGGEHIKDGKVTLNASGENINKIYYISKENKKEKLLYDANE